MKLEINGKNYNLNFGLGAFELASDELNMTPDEVLSELGNSKVFNRLVYSAIKNALLLEDEYAEVPFNYFKFLDEISQKPQEINEEIQKAFWATARNGKTFAEWFGIDLPTETEVKKKGTRKKQSE